jgi:hypothetical protein
MTHGKSGNGTDNGFLDRSEFAPRSEKVVSVRFGDWE